MLALLSLFVTLPNKLPGMPRVGGHLRELTEFYQAWAAAVYVAVLGNRNASGSPRAVTGGEQRQALEATRAELLRAIARATSREVLVPKMERAGMHLPSDLENVPLRVDPGTRNDRGRDRQD